MNELRYANELTKAMDIVCANNSTMFIGQSVASPGTAMFNTLKNVPQNQRLELPVAEEFQLGMTLGLALAGAQIVSIFPRWNFLLLAMNQLVNHLDKRLELFSRQGANVPVILRTAIGSERPLHPGAQHTGDFSAAVVMMCPNIRVIDLNDPDLVVESYIDAMHATDRAATILVEHGDFYHEK
jgi:pyruvate/2-oxoglutarate/acetoin dehydrogenase E1 component